MAINYSHLIYYLLVNIYEKKYKSCIYFLLDFNFGTIGVGLKKQIERYNLVLRRYLKNVDVMEYKSEYDEEKIVSSILKQIPMVLLHLDVVTMKFESFLFSDLAGENLGRIMNGPGDIKKHSFSLIYRFSLFGLVITLSYLTYLSLIDVFIDIFYCHEMKRKPFFRDENGFQIRDSEEIEQNRFSSGISHQTALYNEIGDIENNDNYMETEIVTLNGIVSPLRIRWLRHVISDSSGLKCIKFMRLPDEDEEYGDEDLINDYNGIGDVDEIIMRGLGGDLELVTRNRRWFQGRRVVVLRILPQIKEHEEKNSKRKNSFFVLSLYMITLIAYQFLDTTLKLFLTYIIIQVPYWPWNILITITTQTIILGMCFTFQNSPMTNFIIGFLVNIFGTIPLLLTSQCRIKHNVKISLSLLSLRSIEFLFFILVIIIIPYNTNLQELYLLNISGGEMKNETNINIYGTFLKQIFTFVIVLYFIHQVMLFLVLRIIVISPPAQNEQHINTNQGTNLSDNNSGDPNSETILPSANLSHYYRLN
ncbi:hypothetical protein FG386_000227 [Cryptosporidium ryanae]|uniref:uncharacterized protein n=1 Tax=Cryptosporidium ryanae TaxID=515981 RepID=UPI00351A18C1|nr:hypothetical protein FG386_000227 [Cryptosporidium ryanae]